MLLKTAGQLDSSSPSMLNSGYQLTTPTSHHLNTTPTIRSGARLGCTWSSPKHLIYHVPEPQLITVRTRNRVHLFRIV